MSRWARAGRAAAWMLWTGLAIGCGPPTIDPTDLEGSIADLREAVDEDQRVAFDAAIALVREASAGRIDGTDPFPLAGMTAPAVVAEAERIAIRRERALEQATAAAHRAVLEADGKLAALAVVEFAARPVGDTEMEADVTVRNGLGFPVDTAWLRIEVAVPDGASQSGEEFVAFQPALAVGEQRTVRILVLGTEARSLPVEPPAVLTTQFRMAERGGEVMLKAPTDEERAQAEKALAEAEARIRQLDTRLAAVATPG